MNTFTKIASRLILPALILTLFLLPGKAQAQLGSKVVVGYFQNWNVSSAPYIRLRDVNPKYNVINVAFATPVSFSDMTMTFAPTQQTKAEFISDIQFLQSQGRRVQISIGGADAPVELKTTADKDKFVSSMKAIITEYGFNGYDIDLEGNSVILDNGDTNFKSPTTPKIVNLISASRDIVNFFRGQGKDFWLTSAPETQYVQGGYGNYGTAFGGYLPVLYALRDILTFVHVQYYNTGSQVALDDKVYAQSSADFIVTMTDMLLRGFPVARNTANVFPALREDQVAFGLPATNTGAAPAGGYVSNADVTKALNYLVKGISYGSGYVLPKSYPGLRGIMTWSVNWDKTTGDSWVNNAYSVFSGLGGNVFPSVSITSPANGATFTTGANITINASASDSDGSISKVDFYNGTTLLGTDTSTPYSFTWNGVGAGSYSLTAKATDNQSAVSTSSAVSITVGSSNNPPTASITSPTNGASFTAPASIVINANATDDGSVSKVDFYNGTTLLGTDTSSPYSFTWSNVAAGSYSLNVKATDNTNLVTTSSSVSITVNSVATQSPYGGTVRNLPGKIEAEHYDLGGQGVAYNDLTTGNAGSAFRTEDVDIEATTDTGTGYNVGWIQAGEWLEYTVNVTTAGTYTLSARVAATAAGKTFHIEMDGVNVSGTLTVPNTTGWQIWQTVTATTTSLATGQKVMRIYADQGDFNINYVDFASSGNPAPTTSITSPANGATFTAPATINIAANASDTSPGTVASVSFYNGTTLLGTDTSSPYTFSWSNVAAGSYTLTTKATDNQGAVGTSAAITITVNGTNPAPTTSITSPANNATFTAPATINIAANAADTSPGTVASVAFYSGTTLLGTDTSSPYTFSWSGVAAGTYTLTTKATDNQGAVGTSAAVTITVTGGTGGCTGKPQYVENNGYVAGSQVQNVGSLYECKPYPYSGWCNGAAWAYAPGTGTYWTDAWILKGSCSARSAQNEIEITTFSGEDGLFLSPNPGASGKEHSVILSFEANQGNVKVYLHDMNGSGVMTSSYKNVENTLKVEMPALPNGLYIIRVQSEKKSWVKKYMIK
jgi:chitinase